MRLGVLAAFAVALSFPANAWSRGVGVESYFVSTDGKLVASLGNTRLDLIDPADQLIVRLRNGTLTAARFAKPDQAIWSVPFKESLHNNLPIWGLTPKLVVLVGVDTITGLDRATGKIAYQEKTGEFTRRFVQQYGSYQAARHSGTNLLLIDESAQHTRSAPNQADADADRPNQEPKNPAILALFDLTTGKFAWKAKIAMPSGKMLLPAMLTPEGTVRGRGAGEVIHYDLKTGRVLDMAPPKPAPPASLVQAKAGEITFRTVDGKAVWTVPLAGKLSVPVLQGDAVLVPVQTNESKAAPAFEVVALNSKDGSTRWRCSLPKPRFADQWELRIEPVPDGMLVHLHWTILD